MYIHNIKIYHLDAFTARPFMGNPAAICVSRVPLEEKLMQNISGEINLSETAFVVPAAGSGHYTIRWFTSLCEVDLCGHATLAAAKVLYDFYEKDREKLCFSSRSGALITQRCGSAIMLDFPIDEAEEIVGCTPQLLAALGIEHYKRAFIGKRTRKLVLHIESEEEVRRLKPDFAKLAALCFDEPVKGLGITAKGSGSYDIVVRYFNPWAGVNEDPVTGSVHTLLMDYWGKLLQKEELLSYQASARGGEIRLKRAANQRVELWGEAVLLSAGDLYLE